MSIIPIPSIDADAAPALAIAVPAQIPSTEAVTAVEGNSTRKQQRMTSVAAGVNACSSALGGGGVSELASYDADERENLTVILRSR